MNNQSTNKTLVAISDWPTQLQVLKLLYNTDDLVVRYLDDEDDEIGILNQKDFDYALELARHLNHTLVLLIKNSRGQKIAETRLRVEERVTEKKNTNKETKENEQNLATARQNSSLPSEKQSNSTQTFLPLSNDAESVCHCNPSLDMSLIEGQFIKFKKEISDEIENKLSLFMNQLRHTASQSPIANLETEQDYEFANDLGADTELASRVSKMLKTRSDAEAVGRRLKLAYFEEELEISGAFNSEFIKDCNVPDGTQLRPHVKFEKMWMLKNTGRLEWNHETFPVKLICVSGNIFVLNDNNVDVKNTATNEIATVSVNLMTPSKPGSYFSEWRLSCNGYHFGPKIWCSIEVVDDATKLKTELVNSLIDLTSASNSIKPTGASTSFNNSTDSFEEVNTSSFQDNNENEDEKNFEDDILVVPDCFNLDKEWKNRQRPYASSSRQSECNIEIFEEGLESRQDLTSTHADTSLNSSFSKELDNTLGKDEETTEITNISNAPQATTVLAPSSEENPRSDVSPAGQIMEGATSGPRKSFDEEVLKNVSGTIDLMKNAFKNLSGPSYVGYVCDLEANKENKKSGQTQAPLYQQQMQQRSDLLKQLVQNYDTAPIVKKELTNMDKLIQMGFANRALNDRLLRAYNNDIQKVVQHLTQRSDSNWSH